MDGLAITDHDYVWSLDELKKLKKQAGVDNLVILRGKEIEREGKHLLIFNYPYQIGRWPPLREIIDEIHDGGGIVILAHPFRYGRFMDLSLESYREFFTPYDAVELLTPQHSDLEKKKALLIQQSLQLVGIGGSDSHDINHVGKCVTYFPTYIKDEKDLAQAIREGNCQPLCGYRHLKGLAARPLSPSFI